MLCFISVSFCVVLNFDFFFLGVILHLQDFNVNKYFYGISSPLMLLHYMSLLWPSPRNNNLVIITKYLQVIYSGGTNT